MQTIELGEQYEFLLGFQKVKYIFSEKDKYLYIQNILSLDPKKDNKKFFGKIFFGFLSPHNPFLRRVEHGDIFGLFHFFNSIFLKSDV